MRFAALWMAVVVAGAGGQGAARADGPGDNLVENVRPIPPAGVDLEPEVRKGLEEKRDALGKTLQTLRQKRDPLTTEFLPDVEIFHRAVDQALKFNEFFDKNEAKSAEKVLAEGEARAAALLEGKTPWTRQTGLVVRGYRSKLDGTCLPYGLVIPDVAFSGGPRMRCDVWCRGRSEKGVELQFIAQRMTQVGPVQPEDTLVLHPFGRYCNANKLAGEVDTLEALEHAQKHYRVDAERIAIRGFSMGGAAAWHLAVHYPDKWFAANPGAGFSETPDFLKVFQSEKLAPTWYEQKLWRMYDCPGWAANLWECPTIAYSGEIDKQKQAADIMEPAVEKEGMVLTHIIGPKTAHAIHPDSLKEIEQRLRGLAKSAGDRTSGIQHFATYTLKYNSAGWFRVHGIKEHWEEARIDAKVSNPIAAEYGGFELAIKTKNVTDFTIQIPPGAKSYETVLGISLTTEENETPIRLGAPVSRMTDGSLAMRVRIDSKKVEVVDLDSELTGLRKRHNLQGPIDDAFMDSFLFVKPSGKAKQPMVEEWVQAEMAHAVKRWRQQMRGDARVKADSEIKDDDIARHNLILWGDPTSNAVLAKIADKLPVKWTESEIIVGDEKFPADKHAPVLIYPNPLNPSKYVVLNSGFTYRAYDDLNNARQVPKLPDWAVIDLTTKPNARWPGKVVAADFFDEGWQLKPKK
ncbi:prolyl oligopeptidase family serine peptidase [Planctomyces sp. SH-PL14]|uniref:prolyl oligopeptidase family serine peptidase n=1 Tax=Planctomyces sp. SH-PL14 TaxID=1632864 RepID=UPI00078CC9BF|nr:prolyl oligopeptidase family serine peptidase [Planctomyces sp. SH-PL14]AMV22138.1 Prolyl oligopeptidase family protein [Planctomyces sp. SH-PL14]